MKVLLMLCRQNIQRNWKKKSVEENVVVKLKTEVMVCRVENDADEEIAGYRMKFLKQVQEQKSLNIDLEAEIETLKRKVNLMKQKLEGAENQLKKKENEGLMLHVSFKKVQGSLERTKENIREKECAILQREERINEMIQLYEELKKLNFLLKYDAQEKAQKLKPLEEENETLHRQSKSLEEKLAQFERNNRALQCDMISLQMRVKAIESERARARDLGYQHEFQLSQYRVELSRLMGRIQNPNQMKEGIIALYRQQVVNTESSSSPEPERSIFDSYGTHLEHSEAKIQSLRNKMAKEITFHKVNYRKVLKEHSNLIQEINELRKELSSCRAKLRDFEIYFGISSIDLAESSAARAKVEEALRIEKESKKNIEKSIIEKDKVILNQGAEIRRLHNIMTFDDTEDNEELSSEPPLIKEEPVLDFEQLSKSVSKSLELDGEKGKSFEIINLHREMGDNASSDGDSNSDQEDFRQHRTLQRHSKE